MTVSKLCTFSEYKDEVTKQLFNTGVMLLGMKQSEITSEILLAEKGGKDFNAVFIFTAPNGVSYGSSDALLTGWFIPYLTGFIENAFDDPMAVHPFSFMGDIYKEIDKITAEWMGKDK